ncbi:hypothetical protein Efla_004850 [Eimeria flavescens]
MVRAWNSGASWHIPVWVRLNSWSLILCLAILAGSRPIAAFQEISRKVPVATAQKAEGHSSSNTKHPVHQLESEHVDSPPEPESARHALGGPTHERYSTTFTGSEVGRGSSFGSVNYGSGQHELRPSQNKRNLRLGERPEVVKAGVELHVENATVSSRTPFTVSTQGRDVVEVESHISTVAHTGWPGNSEIFHYPGGIVFMGFQENRPPRQQESRSEDLEGQNSVAPEESASPRKAFNFPRNFRAIGEAVSIPSPLAHSLLYRTRDIINPLNFANFLAEGQEWLIPGTGGLWEGLGRRVDSLFSGLFLKTASVLPDYTRNVIICYKEYKPSMWIEMLGLRNQFLRQLASLFHGTHRMQSVYLRNLGIEIFEVPPLWHVGEFIATVLKLKNFVSHVYTDHLLTDFDEEAQTLVHEEIVSQDSSTPSSAATALASQGKETSAYLRKDPTDLEDGREPAVSDEFAPRRRLEVMTNDPFTWQQWAIVDSGPARWGIEAPTAWDVWTGQGLRPRFTVAVIDSGVDYEHPDLKNQIWRNPDEICGNGIDDDFNGFVDDCIGWDFVKGTSLPMDENGHGTASAGIIAAEPNNGIGLTGVCWGCDILVLKALNEEIKGTISAFARSLDYAIGKGVMLSNNSYGGRGSGFRGLEEAVQRARQAGMIVVAAAGNYNGNNDNDKQPVFPASYDLDNVVSVAAISRSGHLAPFSSYGRKQVDVAAPGANIMTTSARKSYRSVSGTSFAVPMVTGTLALLWTRRPHLNYRQVIQRMLRSVKKNPHLEGLIATGGTVDAWSTLAHEDLLDPYAAKPVLPMTCVSAACSRYASFGSYQCKCRKGFQQTQEACIDIDECALGLQKLIPPPCPFQARCYNFSGTFDCICPHGAVWNGLSGPASQCLRISSPGRGPCAGNGGCGSNALCQAYLTASEASRRCSCIFGFKPLRIGNQEVAEAMAKSRMSSFDNTVCIREDVLPEEQAYYLISMHRERMRLLREASEGLLPAGHIFTGGSGNAAQLLAHTRTGQPAELYRPHISYTHISTRYPAGPSSHSWPAAASTPGTAPQAIPVNNIPLAGSPPALSGVSLLTTGTPIQVPYADNQQVAPLARGSCLLGVCIT